EPRRDPGVAQAPHRRRLGHRSVGGQPVAQAVHGNAARDEAGQEDGGQVWRPDADARAAAADAAPARPETPARIPARVQVLTFTRRRKSEMALKIRLARAGAKKRPFYKIVVADSRCPRDGRFIERIGSYDPMLPQDNEKRVIVVEERAKHWLKLGATPSDRVARMLSKKGLCPARAIPTNQTKKDKPRAKTVERMEAAKKAAGEAAPAAEAKA